eukprot:Hpha_TRINITY_DN34457_c0_g1::TRINITY_DN34457_c0_g1_i1::g.96049::m.96049
MDGRLLGSGLLRSVNALASPKNRRDVAADSVSVLSPKSNVSRITHGLPKGGKHYANDEAAMVDAACAGDAGVVERILLAGVDADASVGGEPALHIAAEEGQLEVVRRLVKLGATVDLADNEGRTALHAAARNNRMAVAAYLISNGAEVDRADGNGRTALHLAAMQGLRAQCTYLIAKGADIHLCDADGLSAVDHLNNAALPSEAVRGVSGAVISEPQLRQLFNRLRPDDNGTAPLPAFERWLAESDTMGLPPGVHERRVADILAEARARGDNRVRYGEFCRAALRLAAQ